jgi:hypothetical protein
MSESKLFNALRAEDRQSSKGKKSGGSAFRYALIGGIILLIVFNVLFVDFGEEDPDRLPQPGLTTPAPPDTNAPELTPDLGSLPIEAGSAEDGNQARQLIEDVRNRGNTTDPETLFAQAQTFAGQGQLADAYLLYFYLAKQGHGPSTLVLAEMADPAYYDARTSFFEAPDFSQAHKWYLQAMMLGMGKAEAQLRDLKLRVKAAAAGGDEKARRLLVGW